MKYVYLKEGSANVDAFHSFIDIAHNTFDSHISDCVQPTSPLNLMPGKAFHLDTPIVIAHFNTPTGPITDQQFLVHPINFDLLISALTDHDFALLAVIPPSPKLLEHEFIPYLKYIGRRSTDGALIDITNGSVFPTHIAVLPVLGFYQVATTDIYCGVVNNNMARLPYNCDITTPTTKIRTIGREDGSLQHAVLSPQLTNATQLNSNIILADQPFELTFFRGPYNNVLASDQVKWWKSMVLDITTNLWYSKTLTGVRIVPSPTNKVGYIRIKFNSGPFCEDSNDPTERFEYVTIILSPQ